MIQSTSARKYATPVYESNRVPVRRPELQIELKRRWQFKPRSIVPFLVWGFVIFLGARLLIIPLIEGVYNYVVKTQEVGELKGQYAVMKQRITEMTKARDYMKTPAYIEERGHQIGLIKSNESKMVVVDSPGGMEIKAKTRKNVEIGD